MMKITFLRQVCYNYLYIYIYKANFANFIQISSEVTNGTMFKLWSLQKVSAHF